LSNTKIYSNFAAPFENDDFLQKIFERMDTLSYKTKSANKDSVEKKWVLIDAEDQTLGRLASKVAFMLRGKHKPDFTPHVDCGDNVVIINAEKIQLTGAKLTDKEYVRYTGYPGGKRVTTPQEMLQKHPERVIEKAVRGMLPKNRLGRQIFKNMFVYAGPEHPHEAQNPEKLDLNTIK
jgi:large subunit ribosomal protein L13